MGFLSTKGSYCSEFFQQVLRKSFTNSGILISNYTTALKIIFLCFLEPKGKQTLPSWHTIHTLWFLLLKTYCCHWKAVLPSHCVQQSHLDGSEDLAWIGREFKWARRSAFMSASFRIGQRSLVAHGYAIPAGCFLTSGVLALIVWNQPVCIKVVGLRSLWSSLFLNVKWDRQPSQLHSLIKTIKQMVGFLYTQIRTSWSMNYKGTLSEISLWLLTFIRSIYIMVIRVPPSHHLLYMVEF